MIRSTNASLVTFFGLVNFERSHETAPTFAQSASKPALETHQHFVRAFVLVGPKSAKQH